MPTFHIEGTRVDGFQYRSTFEQLANIKPPNLKFVQRDATAWFDSPHYAQVAAVTNRPGVEAEHMLQDLQEEQQIQQAIQRMNLDGQRFGVIPRAGARQPDGIQANLAQVQAHQRRAINHEQRALLQAENDGLQEAAARTAMEQAVAPQNLAGQGADQRRAALLAQNLRAGARKALGMVGNRVTQVTHAAAGHIPGPMQLLQGVGMSVPMGVPFMPPDLPPLPPGWRPGQPSSSSTPPAQGQRTRAAAYGPSAVPVDVRSTPQGISILREQIAELTVRADHLWDTGHEPQYREVQREIERLQQELSAALNPTIAKDRRRIEDLEKEAQQAYDAGDDGQAQAIWAQIAEIRGGIQHMSSPQDDRITKDRKRIQELEAEANQLERAGNRAQAEAIRALIGELRDGIRHMRRRARSNVA